MYVYMCASVCICMCVCQMGLGAHRGPRNLIHLEFELRAIANHLTCGCWEHNLDLLEEQQALLTA